MQYQGSKRTIASLYPMKTQQLTRPYGSVSASAALDGKVQGCTVFEMKAAVKGEPPETIVIEDSFQVDIDPTTKRQNGRRDFVGVDIIGRDLVQDHWANPIYGAPSETGPAIWICELEGPTRKEMEYWSERQVRYFTWLYGQGDQYAYESKWDKIQPIHRVAGIWLGKQAPWVVASLTGEQMRCQWCQTQISAATFICPGCKFVLRELPEEFYALQNQLPEDRRPNLPKHKAVKEAVPA